MNVCINGWRVFWISAAAMVQVAAGPPANAIRPIDPRQVKVGGEIGRRIDITIHKNLLAIDLEDDFLRPFREKKRWPFSYVGLGKQIDAVVRLAFHTGSEKLIALKDRLVSETIKTQLPDGHIGIFGGGRLGVWWDVHEMSYVIFGLVSDYRHFGSKASLAAARKAADYMMHGRPARPMVVHVSTIGLERAFVALYAATGQKKYLDYINTGGGLQKWNASVGGHAYDYMNVCLAQLDLRRLGGQGDLLGQSRRVVNFLTRNDGLVICGTCSLGEGWHTSQVGTGKLGETCCTAYLIRLLDRLLQIEGRSLYGDIMERAVTNALPAAQSPDGRELRKYTPFDGVRTYYRGEKSSDFKRDTYCCPNNYRRIIAELPAMIYYRWGGGAMVNLYTPSRGTLQLADDLSVTLRQETDYPNSSKVTVHVAPSRPASFALRLRIPRWCDVAKVAVNGRTVDKAIRGGRFFALDRPWRKGDRVELDMPMSWRLVRGRKAQQGRLAVMRGPMLFCLSPARQVERHAVFGGRRGRRAQQFAALHARRDAVGAALAALAGAPVDLADIVGGGSGFGSGTAGRGVDPRNGRPTTGSAQFVRCEPNVFVPAASAFIDGVTVPDGGPDGKADVPVTSTGIRIAGLPDTCARTWDFIKHGPALSQKRFAVGKVDYRAKGHTMLAVHANKAVTFDLAAIRKVTGYGALRFRTMAGYGGGVTDATVAISVYLDGKVAVKSTRVGIEGVSLDLPLAPERRFLTLAVTDADRNIGHDQVFFGDPHLLPAPAATKTAHRAERRRGLLAEREALTGQMAAYPTVASILNGLRPDLKSIEGPLKDPAVRPNGLACRVPAWSGGRSVKQPPDLTLLLTEYADPGGEATYFVPADPKAPAVDDELHQPRGPSAR